MKKIILLFALILTSVISVFAQEKTSVVVVLKNGTTLTGELKQFDPASKVVINVGGIDATINMSDVSSVTNAASSNPTNEADTSQEPALNLPEDTIINICGVDVKFILMKGGKFKYGFDGRGSRSMKSEPVHDVVLSPFYVSEEFVTRDLYKAVTGDEVPKDFDIYYDDKNKDNSELKKYMFFMSEELSAIKNIPSLEHFMKSMKGSVGEKFYLPSEVQWFYYESRQAAESTRLKNVDLLFCQFATEVSMSDKFDPIGKATIIKGSTKHDDDDEIDTYRLYDRSQTLLTNVKGMKKNNFAICDKFVLISRVDASSSLCPIRLVMKAK